MKESCKQAYKDKKQIWTRNIKIEILYRQKDILAVIYWLVTIFTFHTLCDVG